MILKKFLFAFVVAVASISVYATATTTLTGSFFAYNDTDHTVTIKVGNFIPTSYKITPHGSELIFVSTNNQNIHISEVS